jgi:hypothetical protein
MKHSEFVNQAMKHLPGKIVHDSQFDPIRVQTRKWCREAWGDEWPKRFGDCCEGMMNLLPLNSWELELVQYCKIREEQIAKKGRNNLMSEPEDGAEVVEGAGEFQKGLTLTGLWKRQSQDGKTYLHGYFGFLKLMIFQNAYKNKDTDPDYYAIVAAKPKKPDSQKSDDFGI